jgi:hypothetical protein
MGKLLTEQQTVNYKALLLTLVASVNANADIFTDVEGWVDHNKTVTAIVGVGALTAAAVAVKPLSGLLRAGEEEAVVTEVLAGAEGAGAEAESLEAAASKIEVEEGAAGKELPKEEQSSFLKNVTRDDLLKSIDGYADKGYEDWIAKNAETEL